MHIINHEIRARRIILIDQNGENKGEQNKDDALAMAQESGLDLVIVKEGNPPICKILDYGKFLYNLKKKHKSGGQAIKTKEIKITPVIDDNDLKIKLDHAQDFLGKGHRVKFYIVFRGRHIQHKDIGYEKYKKIVSDLDSIAKLDGNPEFSGKSIQFTLIKK